MSYMDMAPPSPRPTQPRRRWLTAGLVVAALVAGAGVARAIDSPPFGQGAFMRFGGGPFAMDQAAMEDRADKAIRHFAIEIDATPEQQQKLVGIARGLVHDLAPLRDGRLAMALRAKSLLTGASVDPAAIEAFRAEQIGKADAVSKRVTQALTEAAQVLTPEQRQKLASMGPGGAWRGGPFWHRG